MRSANQKLCRRSGVKPKQEIYRQSFDIEITAKSAPAMSSRVLISNAARLSRTGFDALRVTSQRSVKFMAITRQSSKKPSRAYCETMKPSGRRRANAPKRYEPCTMKNSRYTAAKAAVTATHTPFGTTRSFESKLFTPSLCVRSFSSGKRAVPAIRPKTYAPTGRLTARRKRKSQKPVPRFIRRESSTPLTILPKPLSAEARLDAAHQSSSTPRTIAVRDAMIVFLLLLLPRLMSFIQAPMQRRRREKFPNGMRTKPLSASSGSRCPLSPSMSFPPRESAHHTARICTAAML